MIRMRRRARQGAGAAQHVDRIIAIGSDRMMAAIKLARLTTLDPYLKEDHVAIASINSPMQCMMKEVCAQCLQRHVRPEDRQGNDHFHVLQPGPSTWIGWTSEPVGAPGQNT